MLVFVVATSVDGLTSSEWGVPLSAHSGQHLPLFAFLMTAILTEH